MPQTQLIFYRESEEEVPVRDWLAELQQKNRPAFAKCVAAIERLAQFGYELRAVLTPTYCGMGSTNSASSTGE